MRSSDIVADILFILSDNQIHTMSELAEEIETTRQTIHKYIQSLSYRFNIETFKGGIDRGGIRLIPDECLKTNYLNKNELQLIYNELELLQNSSPSIKRFKNSIAPLIEKRRIEFEINKQRN